MEITLTREQLLNPLNQVIGAVERKMTFPILANVLIEASQNQLTLTGTDLEVELKSSSPLEHALADKSTLTLPGKKLAEICAKLPPQATIKIKNNGSQVSIESAKSKFKLATLPASEFPMVNLEQSQSQSLRLTNADFYSLLQRTHFSMAQQDVRYFLNGLLLESTGDGFLHAVATDGHRLATHACAVDEATQAWQIIIPRKTVAELLRLITPDEQTLTLILADQHVCFVSEHFTLTSKLIEGSFPDYKKVIPTNCDKSIHIDRDILKQSLIRASILSNDKHRSVILSLKPNELVITANNPEHEEANESLSIDYAHEPLEIAFNVNYLLHILAAVDPGDVVLNFKDNHSSILITEGNKNIHALYVIMPMRL